MKKKRIILTTLSLIVLTGMVYYFFFNEKKPKVILETEVPTIGNISSSIIATGRIEPVDTVAVGARISGTIEKIYVDYNTQVKKGQLLAQLDKSLFLATVNQNRAALQQAYSNLKYQNFQYGRQRQLYAVGAISKADYDIARNNYELATQGVQSAKAQLYSATQNLSFCNIYSPVDGVVLNRNVSAGQTVASSFNTPTLFTIAKDITKMQVYANVDEADIGNVKKGQFAEFTVDAFLDDVFKGTVKTIYLEPNISANVVTYTTVVDAPNQDLKLKPGMTANITIYVKQSNNAVIISAKALKFRPDSVVRKEYKVVPIPRPRKQTRVTGRSSNDSLIVTGTYVWTLKGKSLIEKQIVTGINNNTEVEVLSGITPNDTLVVNAQTGGQKGPSNQTNSPFMPKFRAGGGKK